MAGGVAVPMADAVEVKPALPPPECGGGESGRRSPEFEFWMVGKNPSSFPSPALLTADELFSGGVVLPLHTLQPTSPTDGDGHGDGDGAEEAARPLAESGGVAPTPDLPAVTFKWKDIFKANGGEGKERKKTERRVSSGVSGNAELININIWPFSRSRSAGAAVSLSRAKPSPSATATTGVAGNANGTASAPASAPAPAARKVGSAPCSRSSSRGESGGPDDEPAVPVAVSAAAAVEKPAGGAGAQEQQPHVHGKEVVGARTRIRTFFSKKVY